MTRTKMIYLEKKKGIEKRHFIKIQNSVLEKEFFIIIENFEIIK